MEVAVQRPFLLFKKLDAKENGSPIWGTERKKRTQCRGKTKKEIKRGREKKEKMNCTEFLSQILTTLLSQLMTLFDNLW